MPNGKKVQDIVPYLSYEHRKKDGSLVSRGFMSLDRRRRMHVIQEDNKGRRLGEVIFDKDNNIVEVIEGDSSVRAKFREMVDSLRRERPVTPEKEGE